MNQSEISNAVGNRPYTICYLNVSAESHIDGGFGKVPEAAPATAVFRSRWLEMKADAIIYGAVTMSMFAGGWLEETPKTNHCFDRTDYLAPSDVTRYYIAISPDRHIAYPEKYIDQRGRGVHGIIHVLTENVSDGYLAYLRSREISYIFCGRTALDPVTMMEKAYSLFGIRKAILSGGAYADWALLSHGLIDEIQTMYLPVVDGGADSHTLFRQQERANDPPVALQLLSAEVVDGDGLLVTYRPKNRRACIPHEEKEK